jgi:hypothetical protein
VFRHGRTSPRERAGRPGPPQGPLLRFRANPENHARRGHALSASPAPIRDLGGTSAGPGWSSVTRRSWDRHALMDASPVFGVAATIACATIDAALPTTTSPVHVGGQRVVRPVVCQASPSGQPAQAPDCQRPHSKEFMR